MNRADFLIIGGGIIGVAVAGELARRHPGARITLIDKEESLGRHASGRNSGVLHAGFYYTENSLKARFCRDGNREWTDYCRERGLPLHPSGKVVVAGSEEQLPALEELFQRGRRNGIRVEEIDEAQLRHLEPRARTRHKALFSPTTATVAPLELLASLAAEVRGRGVELRTGVAYRGVAERGGRVLTSAGEWSVGYVVNAAGLHADQVAHDFGFGHRYVILPFKGIYLYSPEPPFSLRVQVYPVPNLGNPFLGVHYTVGVDGRIKIGPTAIPAFWREHYGGWGGFRAGEMLRILGREGALWLENAFGFRALAWQEFRKRNKGELVRQAGGLVTGNPPPGEWHWGRPGIRAQLLDRTTNRLEMDFVVEGDGGSLHILNAVSPAFTCALPFSRYVVDRVEERLAVR